MAEVVSLKRHRDVSDEDAHKPQIADSEPDSKRQKSYSDVISILELDEDEPDQDLSSMMSSLENEISCNPDFASPASAAEEDEKERVIRHLLEASDDELGIPASKSTDEVDGGVEIDGGDLFGFCEGLWELEDEAANYYTLLQSELFM